MPSQRALIIVASFAASLAITLGVILWLASDSKQRPALLGPAAIGGAFELVDHNGAKVTEQTLIGKPTIIFFGFTHCPDVCPTALFEMSEVMRVLGKDADKMNAFFVSVDPERDTPAVMKDYLGSFDPRLKGLSGSREAIDKIIAAYRVFAKKIPLQGDDYTMDHTALIYLMGKDGKFVAPFNLKRQPEDAAADLKRYL
jgi:protein SCO1